MFNGHLLGSIILVIACLLPTAFWLWMLIDCRWNKFLKGNEKVLWFLLILFTHILGAIAYYFLVRSKEDEQSAQPRVANPEQLQQTSR